MNIQEVMNQILIFKTGSKQSDDKHTITIVEFPLNQFDILKTISDEDEDGKFIIYKPVIPVKDSGITTENAPIDDCSTNGGTVVQIEWWFQTYENGVLVSEVYLYSTYECWGGGGGGGGGGGTPITPEQLCQIQLQTFENQGAAVSQLISTTTTYEDALSMNVVYNWKIYSALTWGLISYEDAVISKIPLNGGGYIKEYSSFTHRVIAQVGSSIGGTRTFQDLGATINKTQTRALVQIDFTVTHTFAGCVPGYAIPYNANREFRILNDLVIE